MNGNNIIIYTAAPVSSQTGTTWTPVAACKSAEVSVNGETIEVAGEASGTWRKYVAGRTSWDVTCGYLVTADAGVKDLLKVGSTVRIKIGGRAAADSDALTGYAIIKECKQTYTRGNLCQGSFRFQGSGALEVLSSVLT